MDKFVNEKDKSLLAADRYTFSVLIRVLKYDCELILSDHEKFIICHTSSEYPVWVWTKDGLTEEELCAVYDTVNSYRPFAEGYCYNLKYELARYFEKRAEEDGITLKIQTNMFAYDCPNVIVWKRSDGYAYKCTESDVSEAAGMIKTFFAEIGENEISEEHCLESAKNAIEDGSLFFWKNGEDKTVACCSFTVDDGTATVRHVCTLPDERRKHYAESLVSYVTELVKDRGYLPILYTDADYAASNACYKRIGYVQRGSLAQIKAE